LFSLLTGLPSRDVPSTATEVEIEMTERQHGVHRGSSLPHDNHSAETSTKITKREANDEVKNMIPIALECDKIIPRAIDKPDSLKNSNNQTENHKLDVAVESETIDTIAKPNEVQLVPEAEKELVNIQAVEEKNQKDVEEAPAMNQEHGDSNTNKEQEQEPESETEFRLTMIHSVREAVNRICEQAVEKTTAIVKGMHKRNSASTLTGSLKDRDQSEHTDNLSSEFSLPPLPQQYPLDLVSRMNIMHIL